MKRAGVDFIMFYADCIEEFTVDQKVASSEATQVFNI